MLVDSREVVEPIIEDMGFVENGSKSADPRRALAPAG